jgi:hypothetical protein
VAKVFICYRRDDSAGHAGRVHDRLEREFGRDLSFMDVDAVPLGANFIKILREEVTKCDVLLAVIGPSWLDARDEVGNRRLDSANDFVRIEIAAALQRDIPVIPILLDGAKIPRADQLPSDLAELTQRNGLEVRHASFQYDMDKLIRGLKSGRVGALAVQKSLLEERAHKEEMEAPNKSAGDGQRRLEQDAKWGRIGRELISMGVGLAAGSVAAYFLGWGPGIVSSWLRPESSQEVVTIFGLPALIAALALVLYRRRDLLDMQGWISFGIVSCIAVLFTIWSGVVYCDWWWRRTEGGSCEPEQLGPGNPGFVLGYLVIAASLLLLLILRLRDRRTPASP